MTITVKNNTLPQPATKVFGPNTDSDHAMLTIAIPTFRRGEMLRETLQSIREQTAPTELFRVIVVDNEPVEQNDTFGTQQVASKFSDIVTYYRNHQNLGMAGNHNQIVALSQTPWVTILHDDDMLGVDFVRNMIQVIEQAPGYAVYTQNCAFLMDDTKQVDFSPSGNFVKKISFEHELIVSRLAIAGMTINKEVWQKLNGFDEHYYPSFDYNFLLRAAYQYKIGMFYAQSPMSYYRIGDNCSMKVETTIKTLESDFKSRESFYQKFNPVKRYFWFRFGREMMRRWVENETRKFHHNKTSEQLRALNELTPKASLLNRAIWLVIYKSSSLAAKLRQKQYINLKVLWRKMKVAYVVNRFDSICGGQVISDRNYRLLVDTFGEQNVCRIEFEVSLPCNLWAKMRERLSGFNGGLTSEALKGVIDGVMASGCDVVVVANSLYGKVAQAVRWQSPSIRIVTFFHNVEYLYARVLGREMNFATRIISLFSVRKAERLSVINSDSLVVLNKRDDLELRKIYHRASDLMLPTSFDDQGAAEFENQDKRHLNLLFVGYNFGPNFHGIDWFVENVMTQLDTRIQLYIVGRAMEEHTQRWQRSNVHVVGTVEDLGHYYRMSDLVVSPIFEGSGMKTKTAEAMMYGRAILGTKEAFEGYQIANFETIGALCETADDFIQQLNILAGDPQLYIAKGRKAREVFLEKYSYTNSLEIVKQFINRCK